jgi:hypothetical protein
MTASANRGTAVERHAYRVERKHSTVCPKLRTRTRDDYAPKKPSFIARLEPSLQHNNWWMITLGSNNEKLLPIMCNA